jgi:hypothetical protein
MIRGKSYRPLQVGAPWFGPGWQGGRLQLATRSAGRVLCWPRGLSLVAITLNCRTYRIAVSIFFMAARKVFSEYSFVNMLCRSCNLLFKVKCASEIKIARSLANQTVAGIYLQIYMWKWFSCEFY